MKPTKKEVEEAKKKAKSVEKKPKDTTSEDIKDLQEIVVGMGERLSDLENLYKRVKSRLGI